MKCSNRLSYTDTVNSLSELYDMSVSVGCFQREYCESDVILHNSHDKCGFCAMITRYMNRSCDPVISR